MGVTTGIHTKGYAAAAAVEARRIVKYGAADGVVVKSAAATDFHIGVSQDLDRASGETVDVVKLGTAEVDFGGTVTRGASVTSDASGKAVLATTGQRAIGFAEVSAVNGDTGTIDVLPHTAA